jgi:hypothetical protein
VGGIFSVHAVLFVSLAWYTPQGAPFNCNWFLLSVWNATVMPLQVVRSGVFSVRKVGVFGQIHAPSALPSNSPVTH